MRPEGFPISHFGAPPDTRFYENKERQLGEGTPDAMTGVNTEVLIMAPLTATGGVNWSFLRSALHVSLCFSLFLLSGNAT